MLVSSTRHHQLLFALLVLRLKGLVKNSKQRKSISHISTIICACSSSYIHVRTKEFHDQLSYKKYQFPYHVKFTLHLIGGSLNILEIKH